MITKIAIFFLFSFQTNLAAFITGSKETDQGFLRGVPFNTKVRTFCLYFLFSLWGNFWRIEPISTYILNFYLAFYGFCSSEGYADEI